jgi:hypothetical protein
MARSFYGKWYVKPDGWSKLQSKALEDQKIDGVASAPQPTPSIKSPRAANAKPQKVVQVIDDGIRPTIYHAKDVNLRPKPIING